MAEMLKRVRKQDRQRGRVQSSGERKGMAEGKCVAGIGLRVCWKSPGSRVRTQWPPTGVGARARAEDGEEEGCSLLFVMSMS